MARRKQKRYTLTQQINRINQGLLILAGVHARAVRAQNRDELIQARRNKVEIDSQVAEMRRQKLCNDLVIQDMKIELLKHELESRGLGKGAFVPVGWEGS